MASSTGSSALVHTSLLAQMVIFHGVATNFTTPSTLHITHMRNHTRSSLVPRLPPPAQKETLF